MATVTAKAEVKADPGVLWSLWTDPARMAEWLPITTSGGPLREGNPFVWQASAPFVASVVTTGRVRRLDMMRTLELELDLRYAPTPSTVTVDLIPSPDGEATTVAIRHDGLPDDDLGLFEANGYGHYWLQHLESLTACAEQRSSDHHHHVHVGVHFVGGHSGLGVLVGGVVKDSPAHLAGLQAGDIVTAVDGASVRSIVEFDNWLDAVAPGATARFSLLRTELLVRIPHDPNGHEGGESNDQRDDRVRLGPR